VFLDKPFTAVVNNAAFDKKWSASEGKWWSREVAK
jgi:hypothetical protein